MFGEALSLTYFRMRKLSWFRFALGPVRQQNVNIFGLKCRSAKISLMCNLGTILRYWMDTVSGVSTEITLYSIKSAWCAWKYICLKKNSRDFVLHYAQRSVVLVVGAGSCGTPICHKLPGTEFHTSLWYYPMILHFFIGHINLHIIVKGVSCALQWCILQHYTCNIKATGARKRQFLYKVVQPLNDFRVKNSTGHVGTRPQSGVHP